LQQEASNPKEEIFAKAGRRTEQEEDRAGQPIPREKKKIAREARSVAGTRGGKRKERRKRDRTGQPRGKSRKSTERLSTGGIGQIP
jgi:hypothetical protein